jgi:hypothetical protein
MLIGTDAKQTHIQYDASWHREGGGDKEKRCRQLLTNATNEGDSCTMEGGTKRKIRQKAKPQPRKENSTTWIGHRRKKVGESGRNLKYEIREMPIVQRS